VHDRFKQVRGNSLEEFNRDFDQALKLNKDLESGLQNAYEDLDPLRTWNLFENIQQQEIILFNMDYRLSHPKDFLVTHIPAPPVCIRPSVQASHNVIN
jgi:DNA-directed RNA polymerase III subunit RPC1